MSTDSSRTNAQSPLAGQNVCATGRLLSLTHEELAAMVAEHGGNFLPRPRRTEFTLIVGDDGWPAQADGTPTRALTYAARLRESGYRIEIVGERTFLERLGVLPGETQQQCFTIRDLTRILNVPAVRLRRWIHAGLLVPVSTVHRLAYFDYQQVTNVRRLNELLTAGVSLRAIRQGLEQMRRWLPEQRLPLAQVARLQQYNRLLWRIDDRLVDRHGQQHFEFEAEDLSCAAAPLPDVDYLFDRALAHEDSGQFEQSLALYQQAIVLAPDDAVLHFNLGNVQFALCEYESACASYRRSVEIDGYYVEAWNNLGNTLAQLEKFSEACEVLQQALAIVPDYIAAQESLAELLQQSGADAGPALRVAGWPSAHPWLRIVSEHTDRDGSS